jgi:hypothetical protein
LPFSSSNQSDAGAGRGLEGLVIEVSFEQGLRSFNTHFKSWLDVHLIEMRYPSKLTEGGFHH